MVSRIEAHIVSHYRSDRATELGTVLESILGWKNCITKVVITSNNDEYAKTGLIDAYRDRFKQGGHELLLNVVDGLSNPRMLTWEHKRFIEPWIEAASPEEDFFIYLEDDIALSNDNLRYFIQTLPVTSKRSLIPGFLRYELKGDEKRLVDTMHVEYWERDRTASIDGALFHACINPYWAGFILNLELAREYVKSASFTPKGSEFVPWHIQERSAMGLTFERPSRKLRSRIVIPIVDGVPDPACLVWHCSNSYTAEDHPIMGRLTVAAAFKRETTGHYLKRKFGRAVQRLTEKRK
jgi:hypothetical protein